MKIRHDVFLAELLKIIEDLSKVRDEVLDPVVVETFPDGLGLRQSFTHPYRSDGIPKGLRVDELEGVDTDDLRSELLLAAGKLEVLASL